MHEPVGAADANVQGGVGGELPKHVALFPREQMTACFVGPASASDTVHASPGLIAETKMKYASICVALVRDCRDLFPRTSDVRAEPVEAAAQLFKAGKFAEAGELYATNRRPRSEGLFGNPPAGPDRVAFQPARRRAEDGWKRP